MRDQIQSSPSCQRQAQVILARRSSNKYCLSFFLIYLRGVLCRIPISHVYIMASTARLEQFTQDKEQLEFPEILRGKRLLLATESFGPVNGQ